MNVSSVMAVAEALITMGVVYIFVSNLHGSRFPGKFALGVVVAEAGIIIASLIFKSELLQSAGELAAWAAARGTFALIVFHLLMIYCLLAYRSDRLGVPFFKTKPRRAYAFLALWMLSFLSGEILYLYSL